MVFFKHSDDFWVYRDRFFSKENWWCIWWLMLYNLIPRMLSDIGYGISLGWIRIQDARYQILSLF